MVRFSLNIKTCCLYVIWESKIKFGQKLFASLKICTPVHLWTLVFNFFLRKVCSLWNSLPLEIESPSHANFMNRWKPSHHVAKHSSLHLLGGNPRLTSVRCILRVAHSPLIDPDLQLHNSPADWAREMFKPSTDSASLLVNF